MIPLGTTLIFALLSLAPNLLHAAVSCPNGDTAGIIKDGKTCVDLVTDDNAECYVTSIETSCCTSCNNVVRSDQNCLYGDKASCFTFLCPSYTDIQTCCETCASFITTQSAAQTTTSTISQTTSTSSASTSTATQGNTGGQSTNTNENSDNDGAIAGAVVGSIVGLVLLFVGAFIAFKLLKKKNNQVEDGTSSGIPEKLDRNSGYIPEKVNVCTVLQEQLETDSDKQPVEKNQTKAKTDIRNYSNDRLETNNNVNEPNTNGNGDFEQRVEDSKEGYPNINAEKLNTAYTLGFTEDTFTVTNGNDVDARGQSLPPLKETVVEPTPIHGVLPPIGASTTNANVDVQSTKTDTLEPEIINDIGKHDEVLEQPDNKTSLTNESEFDRHGDNRKSSRQ